MKHRFIVLCFSLFAASCATGPTARLPSAPPPGEPSGLVGLSPEQIKVAFGAPTFARHDGDVQMWRYDTTRCKAFFFFYPSPNGLAVRHIETLPRPSDAAADPSCISGLRGSVPPVS